MSGSRRSVAILTGVALTAALLAGSPLATPAVAAVPPAVFDFNGSGFGHGVGMSQYGALGMAKGGSTATQILQHYYTGVAVTPFADTMDVRVNIVHAATSATIGSQALATSGGGVEVDPSGGTSTTPVVGSAADSWTLAVSGTSVLVRRNGAAVITAPVVTFHWSGTRSPGSTGTAPGLLVVNGIRYRYGTVDARVVSGRLEVVNSVRLHDEYLRGIGEMPSSWPDAALEAQVVASRSFALIKYAAGVRSVCACNLYNSTADQVFVGWSKESGTLGSRWTAAVAATEPTATTGMAVAVGGSPVPAYFFSSSGGRTQNSEDVWSAALSYTRSVDDHWSLDPSINPSYAAWTRSRTQGQVASAFGLPDVVSWSVVSRYVSGAVKLASAVSSGGASATITGAQLAGRLNLPSTWVKAPGPLQLSSGVPYTRLAGTDRYATAVAVAQVSEPSATTVVLVSGQDAHLVDGMVAAPLAAKLKAPILLATSTGLPTVTAAELKRRGTTTVYMVGGPGALGSGVESALAALGVKTVKRIWGQDRFATAAAVAAQIGAPTGTPALVADGLALPDAMAAAGPAAATGRPVLLVLPSSIPAVTQQALSRLAPRSVTVVGGPAVVSEAVLSQLPAAVRAGGTDRYGTSVAVARAFASLVDTTKVAIASGEDASLVDSLSGSTLKRITLFTQPTLLPAVVSSWMQQINGATGLYVLGGPSVVSSQVVVDAAIALSR